MNNKQNVKDKISPPPPNGAEKLANIHIHRPLSRLAIPRKKRLSLTYIPPDGGKK